jgi:hypothetical protein
MSDGIDARPKNWLVPVALAVLREHSTHGYELLERLKSFLGPRELEQLDQLLGVVAEGMKLQESSR